MQPTLFLVAAFAASVTHASDEIFRLECSAEVACDTKCCAAAKTLSVEDKTCTSKTDGSVCVLCGDSLHPRCPKMTVKNSGSPAAQMLDADGKPVETVGILGGQARMAGALSTVDPTWPDRGVTLEFGTYNGMEGWMDIPEARFLNFGEFTLGLTATVPSFYTSPGYRVRYNCDSTGFPTASDFAGCNIYMFMYRCPPCATRDGNIGARLLAMESPTWNAYPCAPRFTLDPNGAEHQLAMYSAELEDGVEVDIMLEGKAEFIFWAMVGKSSICGTRATEALCDEAPNNCEWIEGVGDCRPRNCGPVSVYHGPPIPTCVTCLDDEEAYIPVVQGV